MKPTVQANTLAHFMTSRVGVMKVSQATRTVASVVHNPAFQSISSQWVKPILPVLGLKASIYGDVLDDSAFGHPEVDALMFYLMNHTMAELNLRYSAYEPLPDAVQDFCRAYHEVLSVKAYRMFHYLLIICTRESRHMYSGAVWDKLDATYGPELQKFWNTIKNSSSQAAAHTFLEKPPAMLLGKYTEALVTMFNKGKWSSGFGGKAWGLVADCLHKYVIGEYSAEMMMDTSFTLCHNNGPIFNKGMLFDMYTSHIYKILDVQRSGQIPQLIYEHGTSHSSHIKVKNALTRCLKAAPTLVGAGYVDWYKVEALGALHKYYNEKKSQESKHGKPTDTVVEPIVVVAPKEVVSTVPEQKKMTSLEVMPGIIVPIVESDRATQ